MLGASCHQRTYRAEAEVVHRPDDSVDTAVEADATAGVARTRDFEENLEHPIHHQVRSNEEAASSGSSDASRTG
jgi:hypothetical protein